MKRNRHEEEGAAGAGAVSVGSGVYAAQRAPITDRVNAEPPILNGMTSAEGVRIALLCLLVYGAASIVIFSMTHWWHVSLIIVMFGTGATVWYGSLVLAKIKRGRPEGYYLQVIHLWMARHGLARTVFIRHSDYWSLGRSMPGGGFSSPLRVREKNSRSRLGRKERAGGSPALKSPQKNDALQAPTKVATNGEILGATDGAPLVLPGQSQSQNPSQTHAHTQIQPQPQNQSQNPATMIPSRNPEGRTRPASHSISSSISNFNNISNNISNGISSSATSHANASAPEAIACESAPPRADSEAPFSPTVRMARLTPTPIQPIHPHNKAPS